MNLPDLPDLSAYLPPLYVWWIVGGVAAVVLAWMLGRALISGARAATRSITKRPSLEDALTVAVASIATGVSAQGMWKFTGDVLHFDGPLRALLFAFIELAVLTSAVRARRNMRDNFSAGIDGIAVWVLAALTAVLSSMDAASAPEAIFRLAAPLVAAWLWERGMAIERRRITGKSRIHWRVTPERILVRLGLAETSDRTASDVDAHRRLTRVAKAAKKARALADARAGKRQRALARLDRALEAAVEYAGVASDESRQRAMLDQIGALYSSAGLLALPEIAPWSALDHPLTAGYTDRTTPGTPETAEPGDTPGGVPGAPVDLPAGTLPHGPVPDELCPVAVARFADDLEAGTAPSLRRIKDELRIGQNRAERIQAYLTQLARTWPSGTQVQPPVLAGYGPPTAATFHEPTITNGSLTRLADDIELTELEVQR